MPRGCQHRLCHDIGGPVDVVFVGRTRTCSSPWSGESDGGEPFGDPNNKNGIYRSGDGSFTLVADIGGWSVDNPPVPAFFVDTGVQYAMERYHGGFLVTDGHHNRVLWVERNGSIKEVATFGNVVPTGLEVTKDRVFITQLGPIPHKPEDGKVLALHRGSNPTEVASGASMLVDVERGPHGKLYALSQGQWDGVGEGSPALPNTGRLVIVERDGSRRRSLTAADKSSYSIARRRWSSPETPHTSYPLTATSTKSATSVTRYEPIPRLASGSWFANPVTSSV